MTKEFTVACIQCGVGNLLGFYQSRFKPLYFVDDRKHMKAGYQTIEKNFPGCVFDSDIDSFATDKADVLLSSPSCAQLSKLGSKRKDRKYLYTLPLYEYDFVVSVEKLFHRDAEFIVVEYLKSLLEFFLVRHKGLEHKKTGEFLPFPEDYRTQIIELSAIDYGVPQNRKRLFLIFSKLKYDFIFNSTNYGGPEILTVGDILNQLSNIRSIGAVLKNDKMPNHNPERVEGFRKLKIGESYYGTQNNTRLDPSKICPVITSHLTRHVHSYEPRVLNARECASFQGFPLDFEFYGSEQTCLDLIGKTVPPPITHFIANQIKTSLEKYNV